VSPPSGIPCRCLRYVVRLVRVRDWWDKILYVAGAAFLLWNGSGRVGVDAHAFALYVAGVLCLLIGGYTINDVADFPQDTRVPREDIGPTPRRHHSLVVALAGLVVGMTLLLAATREPLPRAIAVVNLLIGVEYSLPPMRFKERGVWGVIVGAWTQKPGLFLVSAAMLGVWNWLCVLLTVWLFCGGALAMLGHQILDHRNDLAAGVRTFVTRRGPKLALRLCFVCACVIGMTVLAPFAFAPAAEALPMVGMLAALSSVYAGKGLRALRKLRQ